MTHTERHGGERARAGAAQVLGKLDDARAVPLLIATFRDWNDVVRASAVKALSTLGAEHALAPLLEALEHDEVDWSRAFAADALGRLGDMRAVPPLLRVLERHAPSHVHGRVADALGRLRATEAIDGLVEKLQVKEVTSEAAYALSEIADPAALPRMVDAIGRGGRDLSIICSIADFGGLAVPVLESLAQGALNARDRDDAKKALVRARAIASGTAERSIDEQRAREDRSATTVHEEPDPAAPSHPASAVDDADADAFVRERRLDSVEAIASVLDRPDARARALASNALRRRGPPAGGDVVTKLVTCFAVERSASTRVALVNALEVLATTPAEVAVAAPPLMDAARCDGAWGVRAAAAAAIAAFGSPGCGEVLARMLRREHRLPSLRRSVAAAFERLPATMAIAPLTALLEDATLDAEARCTAARLLGAAPAVVAAARSARDRQVRAACLKALAKSHDGALALGLERWVAVLEDPKNGTDDDDTASAAAAEALSRLDPTGAHLARIATNGSRGARRVACALLAARGDDHAVELLTRLVSPRAGADDDPLIDSWVAEAVVDLLDRSILGA